MVRNAIQPDAASKPLPRKWVALAIASALSGFGLIGFTLWRVQLRHLESSPPPVATAPALKTVTALGRLEPQGEVIQLSAPTAVDGSKVEQLLVQEGDRVEVGQVIAILDSRDQRQADVEAAQEAVKVAQAQLDQILAGAQQGELAAQRATISRLQASRQGDLRAEAATVDRLQVELENAQVEYQRYQSLYREGAVSTSQRDSKRLTLETTRKSLQEAEAELNRTQSTRLAELAEARATLNKIAEVRPTDVQVAKAEVDRSVAAVNQAKADLEKTYVRSPQNGVVLDVHARPGEGISGDNGIVELGQIEQMMAIAEVYQTDIRKVHPGQRARVTSPSLPGELVGTVERVSAQVRRQEIVNTDPSTNIDARVVEVHVALDPASSQQAAPFTNLQVRVEIEL